MVAIFGWIIPEPFAIPPTFIVVPPTYVTQEILDISDYQSSSGFHISKTEYIW